VVICRKQTALMHINKTVNSFANISLNDAYTTHKGDALK